MFDIIIIGGGPAGFTAGIYATRAGKSVLVIEGEVFGGQIVTAPKVENYPSIKEISGFDFSNNLIDQAMALGVEVEVDKIVSIKDGDIKTVIGQAKQYQAKAVIIATGAKTRKLNLPNEEKLVGSGVSYCAICDGAFFANKVVAVNGGGNSAVEEAIFLSAKCKKVYLIHRRNEFRAEHSLVNQLPKYNNIELVLNATITSLNGDMGLKSVTVNQNGEIHDIALDGLFVSIGRQPDSDFVEGLIDLDKSGYIIADETCKTNVKGIFVAGDVRVKSVRQLTTAVGDGAVAGLAAVDYVNNL